ncbi:hypothetical protein ACFSKU_13930 [Pontibacter silvestris]|uniref:Uncharacterized protein n=2 Tax=Pontibacter silvestris TaxID=2305183 RepID=A0ABW4X1E4_9BACT
MGTQSNLWLAHLYVPIQFVLLAANYFVSFKKPLLKCGVAVVVAGLVLVSIANAFLGEGITQMNSIPRVLESILLIGMAVLYFYQTLQNFNHTYLDRDPMFVLSCGVLIYFAGTSMAYAMFNQALAESYDAARICLTINLVLNIFFNSVLMMALTRTPVR